MSNPVARGLKIPAEVKREAFHLSQAIEAMFYDYPDRTVMAVFIALTAAFQNFVEHEEEEQDALTLFAQYLKIVTDPKFALEADDPATRGYVMPAHLTLN